MPRRRKFDHLAVALRRRKALCSSVDGEVVEVTVAKQGDDWVLAGNVANILSDGRIKVQMPDGTIHFAHSAKVGDTWWIHLSGQILCIERIEPGATQDQGDASLSAPMPGKILQVLVKEGQKVSKGQTLITIDAEILQNSINEVNTALEMADYMFEKQKSLNEQGLGTEIEFEQAKNQKKSLHNYR